MGSEHGGNDSAVTPSDFGNDARTAEVERLQPIRNDSLGCRHHERLELGKRFGAARDVLPSALAVRLLVPGGRPVSARPGLGTSSLSAGQSCQP
jgi:hypothetical protein